jgi:antitoxin component YwqK of YwqJK toxin-antitoxin module
VNNKLLQLLLVLVLVFIGQSRIFSQVDSSLFSTDKKPILDQSTAKKGILGGRIGTSGGPDIKGAKEKYSKIKNEKLPELGLKAKEAKDLVKKQLKKNEYENIKLQKRFSSYGNGEKAISEEFNILAEDAEISMYSRDIRWFDVKMQRTTTNTIKDWATAEILHGPYKRYQGEILLEEGFYYLGTKHGLWATYGKEFDGDFVLLDKQYYKKGHLAESIVLYYDTAKTKLKEVMPITYGKHTGTFLEYYESGNIKTEGHLDDNVKVGKWIEYHEFGTGSKRKKEIQFPKDKYDNNSETFVLREYDTKAQLLFENTEAIKRAEAIKD